jgi:nicotinate phosphoribosyltransferase
MEAIQYGPYEQQLSDGLDFYKATMSQLAYEKQPDAKVTFFLKNRGDQNLGEFADPEILQVRLNTIAEKGFSREELEFLGTINNNTEPMFSKDYLDYLADSPLPKVEVGVQQENGDFYIQTEGDWPMVSFWETVIMAEVNELYFETYCQKNNIEILDLYEEGNNRLTEKIELLKQYPDIKFSDFGTRRHFSYRWQKFVVERLAKELPGQFLGTSNIGLSKELGMRPIGTFAHEMPMVYAAIADEQGENIRESHGKMLDDWYAKYGDNLSVALTDTFGSDFFFEDFGQERALAWKGLRHDSGDPVEFGEKAINFYKKNGVDPLTKTIVFSDGLNIKEIIMLYQHFNGRVSLVFGWGTTLTNDLGIKPLNIVMKAVRAESKHNIEKNKSLRFGAYTVKLSDVITKHTGRAEDIERYRNVFNTRIAL